MLSVLIETFQVSPPDNKDDVVWNLAGVRYPTVGKVSTKPAMPMKVERLPTSAHSYAAEIGAESVSGI